MKRMLLWLTLLALGAILLLDLWARHGELVKAWYLPLASDGRNLRDGRVLFEFLYFVTGGPILLLVGVRALGQIKVGQAAIAQERALEEKRLELKRIEARLALIGDFNTSMLTDAAAAVEDVRLSAQHPIVFNFDGSQFTAGYAGYFRKEREANAELRAACERILVIANRFEHFAVCVGELDQKNQDIVYEACGKAFVDITGRMLGVVVNFTDLGAAVPWIRTYRDWALRIEKDRLKRVNAMTVVEQGSNGSRYVYDFDVLLGLRP